MKKIISKKNLAISISLAVIVLTMAGFVLAVEVKPVDVSNLKNKTVEEILGKIVNWAVSITSIVCILVIVIAGVIWITAGGDDTQLGKARKMLISGIIGLVIALAAYALTTAVTGLFG